MNDADKNVYEAYMENRDEMTDDYLRDLVCDIWDEMEDRNASPSQFEVGADADR